jgi:hypothetical protein
MIVRSQRLLCLAGVVRCDLDGGASLISEHQDPPLVLLRELGSTGLPCENETADGTLSITDGYCQQGAGVRALRRKIGEVAASAHVRYPEDLAFAGDRTKQPDRSRGGANPESLFRAHSDRDPRMKRLLGIGADTERDVVRSSQPLRYARHRVEHFDEIGCGKIGYRIGDNGYCGGHGFKLSPKTRALLQRILERCLLAVDVAAGE